MDGGEQRREALHDVSDRSSGIPSCFAATAGIPDGDLGLQSVDSLSIRLREILERSALDHEVLHETLRTAEDICHGAIGLGHFDETLGFLLLADELCVGELDNTSGLLLFGYKACLGKLGLAVV